MSIDSSTVLSSLRRVVNEAGVGYRVSDRDLQSIIDSDNPRRTCEQIVRSKGGDAENYRNAIDRVVSTLSAGSSRGPQDVAPTPGEFAIDRDSFMVVLTRQRPGVGQSTVIPVEAVDDLIEEVRAYLDEACDILRTGASQMGARSDKVEHLLVEAGLVVPEPEDEVEDDEPEDDEPVSQDQVNAEILRTLKKMNRSLKKIRRSV